MSPPPPPGATQAGAELGPVALAPGLATLDTAGPGLRLSDSVPGVPSASLLAHGCAMGETEGRWVTAGTRLPVRPPPVPPGPSQGLPPPPIRHLHTPPTAARPRPPAATPVGGAGPAARAPRPAAIGRRQQAGVGDGADWPPAEAATADWLRCPGGAGRGLKGRAHVPPRPAARRRLQGEGRNGGLEEKSGINHRRLLPLCIRVSVLENKVSRSNIVPGGAGFCVRFHCGCFWRQREPEARALLCAGGRVPWPWESCPAQC